MNLDIVTSMDGMSANQEVNYGEPVPELVYQAAFGVLPDSDVNMPSLRLIIEELEDVYWELFSLEFGQERQPASFWSCSDYISNLSPEQLRDYYNRGLEIFREDCTAHNVAPSYVSPEPCAF